MAIDKRISPLTGKVTFRVRIRLKGFPQQVATFDRLGDAREWKQRTEVAIKEGRYFKTSTAKKKTLADLIDRYTENLLPQRGRDRKTVEGQLKWWKKELGYAVLADITPQLIVESRDKLGKPSEKTRKALAPASVIRYLASLSVCFSYAIHDLGWMEENPVLKVRKPSLSNERVRFLSADERKQLLKACNNSDCKYLYPIVILALSTGARKSEILNLQWKDIDFEKRLMKLEVTKNKERRSVYLAEEAFGLLKELYKVRRINSNLLFPRDDGKKNFEIKKYWYKALEEARLENFRFHDLRHTTASYLAMEHATSLEIAHVLGHKQFKMVKRYAHLSENHTAGVLERMNAKQFAPSTEEGNLKVNQKG